VDRFKEKTFNDQSGQSTQATLASLMTHDATIGGDKAL
jgi:hypothetical protein